MRNNDLWRKIYERQYQRAPNRSLQPHPLVVRAARITQCGRALDIGAGYGAQTLFLIEQGFQVDAVEFSARSIAYIEARTPELRRSQLRTINTDITKLRLRGSYDIIVCTYVTQYLDPQMRKALFRKLKRHVSAEGVIVVEHAYHHKGTTELEWEGAMVHLMNPDELAGYFEDWMTCFHRKTAKPSLRVRGKLDIRRKEMLIVARPYSGAVKRIDTKNPPCGGLPSFSDTRPPTMH